MTNNYATIVKNYLPVFISVILTTISVAQTTTTYPAGNPQGTNDRRPFGVYFAYERTQAVYQEGPTELNIPVGSIVTSVGFYLSGTSAPPAYSYNLKIYMREVASATVSPTTTSSLEIPANLVYNGTLIPADWTGGNHWVTRTLTYNGNPLITSGSNLEFFIETDWSNSNPLPSSPVNVQFAHHSTGASTQWWQQDGTPPTGNGSVQSLRPNILITSVMATPCPGPPSGVTAVASANPVCAVPFNLSLSGLPPQTGFSFQWYVSTAGAGGPYSPIAGANSQFYQRTQTQQSWYYCQITCGSSANSSIIQVNQNPPTNCYCSSGASFPGATNIGNVTFATLNNVAGGCSPSFNNPNAINSYTDYTSTVAAPNLTQGNTYGFSACQINQSGTAIAPAYFNAFIDYNRDGVFDPVYERVFSAGSTSASNLSVSGTINIPYTSSLGITRMRVTLAENSNSNQSPCGTYNWGETEDYNVNIVAGTPCGPVTPGATITSNNNVCPDQSFVLSLSGNSQGSGQTYQWDSSTVSAGGPWSPVNNSLNYSHFIYYSSRTNATTWYRCTMTCGASTASSVPVQVSVNSPPQCYCKTNLHSVNCNNNWVSNVTLNTLNNSTSCTSTNGLAYTIYPSSGSTTTAITQNNTYTLMVTIAGASSQSISAWIDWSRNGIFESTEWYGLTGNPSSTQASGTYSIPVTVPPNSGTGLTGMRIRSRNNTMNGANDACTQFDFGETEDYFVTINPFVPPNCTFSPATSAIANNTSPCSGQQISLSLSPNVAVTYSGLTYQWQLDTGAAGIPNNWQNVAGATGPTLTTSLTHRYIRFRCIVTCTACCGPVASTPVVIDNSPAKWLGHTSVWNDGANWCGRVPTSSDSVLISLAASGTPAAQYKSPVVASGASLAAYNLEIAATDSLTVLTDSLAGFNVAQHLVNNGKINFTALTADTIPFSTGAIINSLYTPFRGSQSDQLCQLIYTTHELAGAGIKLNDVIDSLFFHIRLQSSTLPYQNFKISYGLTTQTQFSSSTPLTGLTQIYFHPSLDIATLVPGSSGALKLPVTGFTWSDTSKNIVLQICYNTTSARAGGNDLLYATQTSGKQYLQLSSDIIANDGCALTPSTSGVGFNFSPTINRPNITFRFHRPQRPLNATVGSATLIGGSFKNNGSASALYLSNTNLTVTGNVINDGIIKMDTSLLTINPSNAAFPVTEFLNNAAADLSYAPVGYLRKSQIYFNGNNWNNNGAFNPGAKSRVVFGGSNNQTIGGSNATTFNNFRMEKGASAQTITLNQSIAVNDTMVLNNGRMIMNKKSITLNNPGAWAITKLGASANGVIISEDSLSKVKWNIGTNTGAHIIPFANASASAYLPFTLNHTSGDLGIASVATYAANAANQPYPPGVTHINNTSGVNNADLTVDRYWMVSKSSVVTASSNLIFNFSDRERTSNGTQGTGANGMSASNPGKAQPWGPGGWVAAPATQAYSYSPPIPTTPPAYLVSRINTVTLTGYTWNSGNSNSWAIAPAASPLAGCVVPSQPGNISVTGGAAKVCPGDTRTYTVAIVAGVTWNWTPPPGAVINSGQGTNSVNITYNAGFTIADTLRVVAVNSCGSSAERKLLIPRNSPSMPSAITGQNFGVCQLSNVPYSVINVTGITYNWSFTVTTASITSGQGSNAVTAGYGASYTTGSIRVSATNACGTSGLRSRVIKATPSTAAIINGDATVCVNQQGVPYSISQLTGATSYTWTGPAGSHIVAGGITSPANTITTPDTAVAVNYATTAGTLKVRGNNSCGGGSYKSLAVTFVCRESELITENEFDATVYPNPSSGTFTIQFSNKPINPVSIEIIDVIGNIIEKINTFNETIVLNKNNLAKGIYLLRLQNEDSLLVKKITLIE